MEIYDLDVKYLPKGKKLKKINKWLDELLYDTYSFGEWVNLLDDHDIETWKEFVNYVSEPNKLDELYDVTDDYDDAMEIAGIYFSYLYIMIRKIYTREMDIDENVTLSKEFYKTLMNTFIEAILLLPENKTKYLYK